MSGSSASRLDMFRALVVLAVVAPPAIVAWLLVLKGVLRVHCYVFVVSPLLGFLGGLAALAVAPFPPFMNWPARVLGSLFVTALFVWGTRISIKLRFLDLDKWDRRRGC